MGATAARTDDIMLGMTVLSALFTEASMISCMALAWSVTSEPVPVPVPGPVPVPKPVSGPVPMPEPVPVPVSVPALGPMMGRMSVPVPGGVEVMVSGEMKREKSVFRGLIFASKPVNGC